MDHALMNYYMQIIIKMIFLMLDCESPQIIKERFKGALNELFIWHNICYGFGNGVEN